MPDLKSWWRHVPHLWLRFRYFGKFRCGIAVFLRFAARFCGFQTTLTPRSLNGNILCEYFYRLIIDNPGWTRQTRLFSCFDIEKSYCEYHRFIALSARRFTVRLLVQSQNSYSVQRRMRHVYRQTRLLLFTWAKPVGIRYFSTSWISSCGIASVGG